MPQASGVERVLTDRMMQEDKALVSEMLRLFMEVAPERLEKLQAACERGDAATLGEEAKWIGATAGHLASGNLGQCAQSIEQAASRGDFVTVKQDLEALRREIESLEALTT